MKTDDTIVVTNGEPKPHDDETKSDTLDVLKQDLQKYKQWLSDTAKSYGLSQPVGVVLSLRELGTADKWSRQQFVQYHLQKMEWYLRLAYEDMEHCGTKSRDDARLILARIQGHQDRIKDEASHYEVDPIDREAVYRRKVANAPFDWSRFAV